MIRRRRKSKPKSTSRSALGWLVAAKKRLRANTGLAFKSEAQQLAEYRWTGGLGDGWEPHVPGLNEALMAQSEPEEPRRKT